MFVPVVTTIREVGAAEAATNGPGSIVIEIAGARVRAQRGVDLGWLRDVLRAVKARHDRGCGGPTGAGGQQTC